MQNPLLDKLVTEVQYYRTKPFLKAVMAVCALATLADDEVTPMLLPLTEIVDATIAGEAWWIDGYGNVQTNVSPEDLDAIGISPGEAVTVKIGSSLHSVKWVTSYSDVEGGEPMLHVDSSGLLALAVRGGRAVESLNLAEGMSITLAGRKAPKAE